jgi:phytoene desaturase
VSNLPVIVIGSGFGGMAAAVRLRAMGHQVKILEAGSQAGGRARVFKREGFTFDAGPTVITAPYLLEELYEKLGERLDDHLELMPVDPFYRVRFDDGTVFDYVGDEERILEQIAKISPEDVEGYKRLAEQSSKIFEIGYQQLADAPFDTLSEMLRVVPAMVRLKSYKTVYGMVSDYIKDERLRQAFTFQPLLVGGSPFRTSSIYLLIHWLERKWGVHFARGGTAAIVSGLSDLLARHDVPIELNSPVTRIEVEDGVAIAVETGDGQRHPCSMVVSNADPIRTSRLPDELSP